MSDISSYLVLTLPTDDLQLAKNRRDILKQQGITDLWMFKKGQFKWRISLGLFSSSDKALFAKQQYAQQTTEELDVVPSWQTHNITQVTISAQQKQKISDFEQSFANFIDKDANCL
ncbi:hypothetical protein [Methyloprofundus sp.]|uniref:hypothetical protein n=1 Tax=Methyloprofundus sp. TaxID=2020875 RepID=UPI003D11BE61